MVKSMRMPTNDKLHCIGVDDWVNRKGMNYGIVNAETGRPIDLLGSRDFNDVVEWLSNHKEIKIRNQRQINGICQCHQESYSGGNADNR